MLARWAAAACGLAAVVVGCLCTWAICRRKTNAASRRSPYVKQRMLAFMAQLKPTSSPSRPKNTRGPYGRTVYMGRYNLAHGRHVSKPWFPLPSSSSSSAPLASLRGLGCRCFSLVLVNHKLLTNLSDSSSWSPRLARIRGGPTETEAWKVFFRADPCKIEEAGRPRDRIPG